MPKPFLDLSVDELADLLADFPWERRITSVHLHHTFRPDHADFASRPPLQSIEAMFRFHTGPRGFADIAQHVTIDPAGRVWTGRNFNMPPASATGFNGNRHAGPFMIEMIGNFDVGHDRFAGAQRQAAIRVTAIVQKLHGLPPEAFHLHHELSPKTCPGTTISRDEVLAELQAAHAALPALERRGRRDALLDLLNVNARSAGPLEDEGELPEADMTLAEGAMSAGEPGAFRAARGGDDRDLTPEDFQLLRRHVINLRMGALSSGGVFQTAREDVEAIFAEHLPPFLGASNTEGQPLRLVFFAHGGLNDEVESLKNARNRIPFYLANGCYPVFFVWETGVKETLIDIVGEITGFGTGRDVAGTLTNLSDAALEAAFRNGGFAMWANMKRSAEIAFLPRQGGTFFVERLADFWREHSADMELHAIGHSAGSIFHAYFLSLLCAQAANPPIEVQSLHFLAPAITVDLFKELLLPLVGSRIRTLTEFTMHREFELADAVGPYRKSLLYLVSRSFEDRPEMPILGLEESIRRDPDLMRFFGLFGSKPGKGEILFSPQEAGPSHSTIAKKHGDFDNDRLTMSGVIRRILRIPDSTPIVEFPETVSRTVLDVLPSAAAASSVPAAGALSGAGAGDAAVSAGGAVVPEAVPAAVLAADATAGRRRAVCVGIDAYEGRNRLAGCVNDARDWGVLFERLGFDVRLVTDEGATWETLTSALSGLVADAKRGDVLVFQYAGHGTLVDDIDGDELGARDSALCPIDFDSGRLLIDDDVRRIFTALPDGVNLTCFFDCCHSGTITRVAAPRPAPTVSDVRSRFIVATPELEEKHRAFREALPPAPLSRGPMTMKEISFTACTDAQTAQEIDGHGQFTVRALDVLRQGIDSLTNAGFAARVVAAFGSGAEMQTPQLDCAPSAKSQPLFGGLSRAADESRGIEAAAVATKLADIEERLDRLEREAGS